MGRPRLERCGIFLPAGGGDGPEPEHELYDLLINRLGRERGYRHYNSLMRRLVSLEHALDLFQRARMEA